MARLTGLEPATPGVTGRYSNQLSYNRALAEGEGGVARLTGLEPATPGVTGRYSNQLSYNRAFPTEPLFRRAAVLLAGVCAVKRNAAHFERLAMLRIRHTGRASLRFGDDGLGGYPPDA